MHSSRTSEHRVSPRVVGLGSDDVDAAAAWQHRSDRRAWEIRGSANVAGVPIKDTPELAASIADVTLGRRQSFVGEVKYNARRRAQPRPVQEHGRFGDLGAAYARSGRPSRLKSATATPWA